MLPTPASGLLKPSEVALGSETAAHAGYQSRDNFEYSSASLERHWMLNDNMKRNSGQVAILVDTMRGS
jgi:hypothetical protein